jgi:DeoR/GlpR family transcriptional regulator of sugar metabolism
MAHPNLQARRELVGHLAHYGVTFSSVLVRDLAKAFGCSPSAIRVDIQVAGNAVSLSRYSVSAHAPQRLTTKPLQ